MISDEIYRRLNPSSPDDSSIEDLIRDGATIIPLAEGQAYVHPDYAPAHVEVEGQRRNFLIRQRAAITITRDGSDDPDIGLEDTTKAYIELKERIEKPKIGKGETDPCDSIVGSRIENAHSNYCVTKLVKGKDGNKSVEFNRKALGELGFDDPYVASRLDAIAASVIGRENLKESDGLIGIIEHIDKIFTHEERIEGQEFERTFCYAGSHWRIRDDYQKKDGEKVLPDSQSSSTKTGKRIISRKAKLDTFNPDARKYEDEIVEYLKGKGKSHPDIRNLVRTYVNLKHVLPNDREKALPTYPSRAAYERYDDKHK